MAEDRKFWKGVEVPPELNHVDITRGASGRARYEI